MTDRSIEDHKRRIEMGIRDLNTYIHDAMIDGLKVKTTLCGDSMKIYKVEITCGIQDERF